MAGENNNNNNMERVCVTGAGGFTASWIVKLLLSNDYVVHGTIRKSGDSSKYEHLKKLEKASENLKLLEADLLDYDSLLSAVSGCRGVFHVASPVPSGSTLSNPQAEIIEPAVKGTLNVLNACVEAKVKRVVVLSSVAAVYMNPDWPKDQPKDETCWSVPEFIKTIQQWYFLSKTEAEMAAVEFGKRSELEIVTVCPSLILGPILQPTVNTSSWLLLKLLQGGFESVGYNYWTVVDVRDVAEALLLVYKKSEAGERYICHAYGIGVEGLVDNLRITYPNYNYPTNLIHKEEEEENLSSDKLQRLGWRYRPLKETLVDSIQSYRNAGALDKDEDTLHI